MSSDGEGDHGHIHSSVERLKSLGGKRSFNEDGEGSKIDYPAAKRSNIDPGVFAFKYNFHECVLFLIISD